ncbi:hypothetical protein AB0I61_17325 [Polymorphospora rubra]|uniref:hypothetical protein n=1 Tax=Polymorphospora rubra TaxID=338584 RepID=UPI00340FF018
MSKRILAVAVHVGDRWYYPGKPVPAEVAAQISNPDVWAGSADVDEPAPGPGDGDGSVDEVPTGSIADVLEWVGDDPDRAQRALDAEQAGKARTSLMPELERLAAGGD